MAESSGLSSLDGMDVTAGMNRDGAHTNGPGPGRGLGWDASPGTRPAIDGRRGRAGGGPWANMARLNPTANTLYGFGRRKRRF